MLFTDSIILRQMADVTLALVLVGICACTFIGNYKLVCLVAEVKRRPCDPTDRMLTKMPLLRFLSLINDGETLGEIKVNTFIMAHLSNLLLVNNVYFNLDACMHVCIFLSVHSREH